VAVLRLAIFLIVTNNLFCQIAIFPLKDVRAGQRGIGKTIFAGDRIEEFQVEILGVLENLGPKQSVILARLSGGPLEKTGVIQGMSGSPVYIDGRLVGAVALGFSFAKDPIAGIRPIEDMLRLSDQPIAREPGTASLLNAPLDWFSKSVRPVSSAGGELIEIATPLSFNGFTSSALEHFAPELRKLGLEPRQGVSSGGHIPPKLGDPKLLHPGGMITVQLMSGDMSIGADGTITEIDGARIYAFGHRFLAVGGTELPFARADVITTLANTQSSFKISSAREWMGTITQDRSASVYGETGRRATTVPLTINIGNGRHAPFTYNMQMVNDRVLSPFILQMAVYSAIDATERTLGLGSFALRGEIQFPRGVPPLKLDNTYSGDFNVPLQASLGVATPLAYVLNAGFDALKVQGITLSISSSERKRVLQIDQVTPSKKDAHPGDAITLTVTFLGDNGAETQREIQYKVPVGSPLGALQFTVSDASAANLTEYQRLLGTPPKSAAQVVSLLNDLRPNTNAYVRVWRSEAAFQVQGGELPDPPPSLALILAKAPATPLAAMLAHGSTISEIEIDTGDAVVSGSKTAQVEIKE
jgi:hypothetical protein